MNREFRHVLTVLTHSLLFATAVAQAAEPAPAFILKDGKARAEIVMAQVALREAAPEDQVTAIVDARLEDGSWAASGGTETDVVTTASAVGPT